MRSGLGRVRQSSPPPYRKLQPWPSRRRRCRRSGDPYHGFYFCCRAPAPRRYHTRVSTIPPSPPHPRPSWRAPPSKRARTSDPGESSNSKPPEPQSPPTHGPAGDLPPDLSPVSIIWRPYFHYSPIPGNTDCSERDVHVEIYYDLPAFAEDPELRDLMPLVQRYSMELFMTPR